ncbi:hypothetical protein AMS68_005561 [Peltaster fructicola]|uniref:Thioesterase domain-containing protein n=1 Tax=Peltaster fructicola TaxID=286661 RepID=A0A6H0XZ65_9PEZI|nr:hypothetical protein AMS68_005561 [Peltaster fructicola]
MANTSGRAGSLQAATQVKQVDSHTYTADFDAAWTIGQVPHGGYVASVFQRVVEAHFGTTLAKQNQPHTMIFHLEYVRRTEVGPATFKVRDVKLGRQTSTVHITLSQKDREEVLGYVTNTNILNETGVSYPTLWRPIPPRPSVDLQKLDSDSDAIWGERKVWPVSWFRKAPTHARFFFPRAGQPDPSVSDQWMCLRNGENWTNESLGYVADSFPQIIEVYATKEIDPYSIAVQERMDIKEQEAKYKNPGFWFPTLVLNLDVKKALPATGVKWLFVRLQAKQIKNGRYDLEMIIMDETEQIVALSHHVCLAVSAARNTAKRRTAEQTKL